MIEEYIDTGHIRRCEKELSSVPQSLIDLMDIPGLGPKTLLLLHKKYRIEDFEDFKRLLDSESLLKLRGFGEKKVENLRRGVKLWLAGKQRMPLGIALPHRREAVSRCAEDRRRRTSGSCGIYSPPARNYWRPRYAHHFAQ